MGNQGEVVIRWMRSYSGASNKLFKSFKNFKFILQSIVGWILNFGPKLSQFGGLNLLNSKVQSTSMTIVWLHSLERGESGFSDFKSIFVVKNLAKKNLEKALRWKLIITILLQ